MAQVLKVDKFGTLSHGGGIITMAASSASPAWITIGGQQYRITSSLTRTIATDLSMGVNLPYMVYAVVNSGNVELRISANVNSIGPSGFISWKLIGAFYSDAASVFGAFVNIEGVPETPLVNGGVLGITGSGSNPSKGGSITVDRLFWRRSGSYVYGYYEYGQTSAGSAGSGQYLFDVPGNFSVDTTKHTINNNSFTGINGSWVSLSKVGEGHGGTVSSNTNGNMWIQPFSSGQFRIWIFQGTTGGVLNIGGMGANMFNFAIADLRFAFEVRYQANGLSTTPLKDL